MFVLRLEDNHAAIDAMVAGEDAGFLLPGMPTVEDFRSSEAVRRRTEQTLARLEGDEDTEGEEGRRVGGDVLELRVRSYVTSAQGGYWKENRPTSYKRFSIVPPSSLEGPNDSHGLG